MRVTPLVAVVAVLCATSDAMAAGAASSPRPTKEAYLRIADEVDANLQKEILDKWFPVAVDQQGGGFFEDYALDWARAPGSNKSIVYQSRLTWTSAEAARRFPAKADLYLAMTRRGAACLAEKLWDKQSGGFFWTVGANGQPVTSVKQTYGHAFGI
jgi:cellobiose epimerase